MVSIRPHALVAGLLLLAACQAEPAPLTPLEWKKVPGPGPGGALLGPGAGGAFDERANFTVMALREGGLTRLYYGGGDATGSLPRDQRLALAHRPRRGERRRHLHPRGRRPGRRGRPRQRRAGRLRLAASPTAPSCSRDGAAWRMWFNGSAQPFNCPAGALALDRRIGYAESADGVHWTKKYDGPGPGGSVLPLGPPGAIDAQQVGYVWVVKDGPEYRLYYSANDATNTWRVALAVSGDARTWVKGPARSSAAPCSTSGRPAPSTRPAPTNPAW
ncbi:MAG: hypothetical protein MZW92_24275 [Comamonadaceae bacterium]|nr:hypothetical protein [Comamonadaceae bacterium]